MATFSIRSGENFHILLWLIKDLCWVMDQHLAGTIMIIPTIAMALWLAWRLRHDRGELLHAMAVVCWITANSTWMLGEFFWDDGLRPVVAALFLAGLGCVAWHHLVERPRRRNKQPEGPGSGADNFAA